MTPFDDTEEDMEEIKALDQDFETPFSEPLDRHGRIGVDHPSTDTGLDKHELYDKGLSEAAEADED